MRLIARVANALRRIVGVPDYDGYLAHHRAAHPGRPPVSREAFLRERMAERYERPGARCC